MYVCTMCVHTCMRILTHSLHTIRTYILRGSLSMYIRMYGPIQIHVCMYMYIHIYTHVCIYIQVCTVDVWSYTYIHTVVITHIHTYVPAIDAHCHNDLHTSPEDSQRPLDELKMGNGMCISDLHVILHLMERSYRSISNGEL